MSFGAKTGYCALIGRDEHKSGLYKKTKSGLSFHGYESLDSNALHNVCKKRGRVSVCFSPRSIYADIGVFSSISMDATLAHIRSSIDKTGLFNEDYDVSFVKIQDIDGVRAKYSYLAVAVSDISSIEIFDEKKTLIDTFRPIEASIASVTGSLTQEMTITIYQDRFFVRIIGSKGGVIHYLITINALDSFDLSADTLSGINEMYSLLKNSYNATVEHIFIAGQGDLSEGDLEKDGISTKALTMDRQEPDPSQGIELYGTVLSHNYDFTPQKYQRIRALASYAKYSILVSFCTVIVSIILILFGTQSSKSAEEYVKNIQIAQEAYIRSLSALEEEYDALRDELDFDNINGIISSYKAFEAEPKLYTILSSITRAIPGHVSITRIAVSRPGSEIDQPSHEPAYDDAQGHNLNSGFMDVELNGIIECPYPGSKGIFTRLVEKMQSAYTVRTASFHHNESRAEFTLVCETLP